VSAVGDATADVVWQRYTHPARWAGWAPQIRRVDHDDDVVRPGSRGLVHGPLGIRVRFVIDDVDPALRTWAWTVGIGRFTVPMRHGAHPCGTGTLAWAEVGGPRFLGRLYSPVARHALRRLVRP
jgi:hypothetical protein